MEGVNYLFIAGGAHAKDDAVIIKVGAACGGRPVEAAMEPYHVRLRVRAVAGRAVKVVKNLLTAGGGNAEHDSFSALAAAIGRPVEVTSERGQAAERDLAIGFGVVGKLMDHGLVAAGRDAEDGACIFIAARGGSSVQPTVQGRYGCGRILSVAAVSFAEAIQHLLPALWRDAIDCAVAVRAAGERRPVERAVEQSKAGLRFVPVAAVLKTVENLLVARGRHAENGSLRGRAAGLGRAVQLPLVVKQDAVRARAVRIVERKDTIVAVAVGVPGRYHYHGVCGQDARRADRGTRCNACANDAHGQQFSDVDHFDPPLLTTTPAGAFSVSINSGLPPFGYAKTSVRVRGLPPVTMIADPSMKKLLVGPRSTKCVVPIVLPVARVICT